jgi:hypothetical protein
MAIFGQKSKVVRPAKIFCDAHRCGSRYRASKLRNARARYWHNAAAVPAAAVPAGAVPAAQFFGADNLLALQMQAK